MEATASLLVLQGPFYESQGALFVADDEQGTVNVDDQLSRLLGRKVSVVAHHEPYNPPIEDRWGGGSCLFQAAGSCPVGHHYRPKWIYNFTGSGTLDRVQNQWVLCKDGSEPLPLSLTSLVGHRSQVVFTSLPDVDLLQKEIEEDLKTASVEALQNRIAQMRNLLVSLNAEKDDL